MNNMKKLVLAFILSVSVLTMVACDQYVARNLGGDYTHNLPKGEKLINVTWKEDSLWYLTRPFTEEDTVETYVFQTDSVFGVFEGTVTIVESKQINN